jgi:NhaC family Na+:H+ antiporter
VPWNSRGAYMSATLGVASMAYLPFCFFGLINILVSFLYAILGLQIKHVEPEQEREEPSAEASWRAIGGRRVQPTEDEAAVRQGG